MLAPNRKKMQPTDIIGFVAHGTKQNEGVFSGDFRRTEKTPSFFVRDVSLTGPA